MNERLWTFHGYYWSSGPYRIRIEHLGWFQVFFEDECIATAESLPEAKALCAAHAQDQ